MTPDNPMVPLPLQHAPAPAGLPFPATIPGQGTACHRPRWPQGPLCRPVPHTHTQRSFGLQQSRSRLSGCRVRRSPAPTVLPSAATVTSARSHQRGARLVKVTAGGLFISDGQNPRLGTAQWPVHGSKSSDTAHAAPAQGHGTRRLSAALGTSLTSPQRSCGDSPSTRGRGGKSCRLTPRCCR